MALRTMVNNFIFRRKRVDFFSFIWRVPFVTKVMIKIRVDAIVPILLDARDIRCTGKCFDRSQLMPWNVSSIKLIKITKPKYHGPTVFYSESKINF